MVGNLVVEIEIFNFCLFVCDVVSNLVVEIAIYNFDLFHTALMNKSMSYSRVVVYS